MSNRQQGGSPGGVLYMGVAGFCCSPCTTAPLSAILLLYRSGGNMWLGGGTLYLYMRGYGSAANAGRVFLATNAAEKRPVVGAC